VIDLTLEQKIKSTCAETCERMSMEFRRELEPLYKEHQGKLDKVRADMKADLAALSDEKKAERGYGLSPAGQRYSWWCNFQLAVTRILDSNDTWFNTATAPNIPADEYGTTYTPQEAAAKASEDKTLLKVWYNDRANRGGTW